MSFGPASSETLMQRLQSPADCCNGFLQTRLTHLPRGQNGHHFSDDIFICIFKNEKFAISIQISLMFISMGPFDNKSAFVQVMAWHQTGDKPLPKPMLTQFTDAYMGH